MIDLDYCCYVISKDGPMRLPIQAIYTDGSGGFGPYGGRGICGYAAIVWCDRDTLLTLGGIEANSTHQRAELWALIIAINYLKYNTQHNHLDNRVPIFSDSKYAVDALNDDWISKWQHNGWFNKKGKPIDDRDLWLQLINSDLASFHHIMGHSDAPGRKGRLAQQKNYDRFGLKSEQHNRGNQLANLAAGQFRRGERTL